MEVIRDHQHPLRLGKAVGSFLLKRQELVNGVEDLLLDPGAGVKLFRRDLLCGDCIHSLRAGVPISHGVAQGLSFPVQKDKIDAPCVNPHGQRDLLKFLTAFHTGEDLRKKPVGVPTEMPVFFDQSIFKPVDLFQDDLSVFSVS